MSRIPQRDYSILTPRALHYLKKRAQTPKPDTEAIEEQKRRREMHTQVMNVTSQWKNTIARDRMERQTRLQREAEADEERKKIIDEEERKIQKLKKQAALAEAQKAAFLQREEVRAVNSQLLVFEVQQENEQIQAAKERKKLAEWKQQIEFDDMWKKNHDDMLEKENKIKQERRARAIKTAQDFRRQKQEKEERRAREKEQNRIDDLIIAEQMKRELQQEQEAKIEEKRRTRQFIMETMKDNENMIKLKQRIIDIEEEEERRRRALAFKIMDEQDERKAAEEKRRQDRLNARQKLIDAETQRQLAEKKTQEDFLDKQLQDQYNKESKRVQELTAQRIKFNEERRRDYLEVIAAKDAARKAKLERNRNKRAFPSPGEAEEDRIMRERDNEKLRIAQDLAKFQLQQIQEKKDREAAEAERIRLEFQRDREEEQQALIRAQEYAIKLLEKAQQDETNDLDYYNY